MYVAHDWKTLLLHAQPFLVAQRISVLRAKNRNRIFCEAAIIIHHEIFVLANGDLILCLLLQFQGWKVGHFVVAEQELLDQCVPD